MFPAHRVGRLRVSKCAGTCWDYHSFLALTRSYHGIFRPIFLNFLGTKNTDSLVQISEEKRFSGISIEVDVRKA